MFCSCDKISSLKIFVWYGAHVWRRLIPMLVIAFAIFYVWQEAQPQSLKQEIQDTDLYILEIKVNVDAQVVFDGQPLGIFRANRVQKLTKIKGNHHSFALSASGYQSTNIRVFVDNKPVGQTYQFSFKLKPEKKIISNLPTVAFDDLENAINTAQVGAVLHLAAGYYPLSKRLDVQKSITLIGAGKTETRILSSAPGYALSFDGIQLHLQGIDFEHVGQAESEVVTISNSTFSIQNCRFTGGYSPKSPISNGNGLWVYGNSYGKISESIFDNNSYDGIYVEDKSNITIDHSELSNNGIMGVVFWETSQGDVSNNIMHSNGWAGAVFTGSSKGRIYKNVISNSQDGIRLRFQSEVSVEENTFQENTIAIYLSENIQPKMSGNIFLNNNQDIMNDP